jgi:CcmD family protein
MQRSSKSALMMVVVAAWLLSGPVAGLAAQAPAQAPSPSAAAGQAVQNPQDQFVPVKSLPPSQQADQLPAQPLVLVAYAFVWAVLLVYVWTVWRRLLKVEKEIHALSERLKDKRA